MNVVEDLAKLILENGYPVLNLSSQTLVYSWKDYEAAEHLKECPAVPTSAPWGVGWSEFDNTFVENSEHTGVEVKFNCSCGKLTNRVARWEAHMRDVLSSVPEDVQATRNNY